MKNPKKEVKMKTCTFEIEGEKYLVTELWSKDAVQKRVSELALDLAMRLKNFVKPKEKIVLMAVLDGTLFFAADLMRTLGKYFPPGILELETYAVYSYRGDHPETVRVDKFPKNPLKGKHLVLVEDIIDTGGTLSVIEKRLKVEEILSLTVCVLINKTGRRMYDPQVDFVGFDLPASHFLLGYGLDFKGIGREIPWIGKMEKIN